jgi:hypothetical protein
MEDLWKTRGFVFHAFLNVIMLYLCLDSAIVSSNGTYGRDGSIIIDSLYYLNTWFI